MTSKHPLLLLALGLLACGDKDGSTDTSDTDGGADTDTDAGGDTDTDATDTDPVDTDTDTVDTDTVDTDTGPACDPITDGMWIATGQAFGMQMSVDLTSDPAACSFKLDNWDMAMDTPTGGSIVGDQVTLAGSNYWSSCIGTLTGGTEIQGTCAKDGASFALQTK